MGGSGGGGGGSQAGLPPELRRELLPGLAGLLNVGPSYGPGSFNTPGGGTAGGGGGTPRAYYGGGPHGTGDPAVLRGGNANRGGGVGGGPATASPGPYQGVDTRDQALSRFLLDPAAFAQVGQQLQATTQGDYLDPSKTTAGQGLISSLTNQSNQNLNQQLAQLRSRFAQSGQGLSSPLLQAQTQAITRQDQNLNDIIAQQLFQQYGTERGRQLGAAGALSEYEQTPATLFGNLAQYFKGVKNKAPKGSGLAAVGGTLGGGQ